MENINTLWWLGGITLLIGVIWLAYNIGDEMENDEMEKWRKERDSRPYQCKESSDDCYESRKRDGYYDINTSDM